MPIRVIAGSARGRRLKMVSGHGSRPVMDRVKEALFNIIGKDIVGATFLDLFAGTGSVGIEALSRGATRATFVEREREAVEVIQYNLSLTRLESRAAVRRMDVFRLLKQPPEETYDYIYIAPPQYKGLWLDALKALEANPAWIPPGTSVIVQIDPAEKEAIALHHLAAYDERRYGNTLVWFFVSEEQAASTDQGEE